MPIIQLEIDSTGAVKGLEQYEKTATKAGKETDSLTKKTGSASSGFDKMKTSTNSLFTSLGGLPGMITAVSGAIATKLVGGALKAASDLEETQGKFDVVFRGMTESAEAWAATLQNSYAMSATESKKYLSNLQDLIVPTGMAREEAGALSNNFVKMAADLASFNNLKTSQVIEDIQSALAGSSETMLKYGINVKVSRIEQEVFNLGLATTKEAITDAHKAQALYSIMMREGSDAVGDQIRTQDSYANLLKKSQAIVDTTLATIGNVFIPLAKQVTGGFNEWAVSSNGFTQQLGWVVEGIRFVHNGFSGLIQIGNGLIVAFSTVFSFLMDGLFSVISPLTIVGDALVALGALENNPFLALRDGAEIFKLSARDVFKEQSANIQENNRMYDEMKAKIQESTEALYRHNSAVGTATKKTTEQVQAVTEQEAVIEALEDTIEEADTAAISMNDSFEELSYTLGTAAANSAKTLTQEMNDLTAAATAATAAANAASTTRYPDGSPTRYPESSSSSSSSSSSFGAPVLGTGKATDFITGSSMIENSGLLQATNTVNIFNQSLSRNDVSNLTSEQERNASRV